MLKSLSMSLIARGILAAAVGIIALAWSSVTVLARRSTKSAANTGLDGLVRCRVDEQRFLLRHDVSRSDYPMDEPHASRRPFRG